MERMPFGVVMESGRWVYSAVRVDKSDMSGYEWIWIKSVDYENCPIR